MKTNIKLLLLSALFALGTATASATAILDNVAQSGLDASISDIVVGGDPAVSMSSARLVGGSETLSELLPGHAALTGVYSPYGQGGTTVLSASAGSAPSATVVSVSEPTTLALLGLVLFGLLYRRVRHNS